MAQIPHPTFRVLSAFALLLLPACTERPKCEAHGPNDFQVGRYQIVHTPGSNEVLELDTANGKTWKLVRSSEDDGVVIGWELIKDLP